VSDSAGIVQGLRDRLAGRQLIIVSNREPYVHERTDEGIQVERPSGGLVAALDPVMQACGGTWIAWGSGNADFEVTDPQGRVRVPPGAHSYLLRRVRLTQAEIDGFYYGYANQALWPLCHMALEHARFRRRAWVLYEAANQRFAEAVLAEAPDDAIVWVHDYHLARVPRYMRTARPDLFTMHFWHIPWPAWDIFRACPQRSELLDGLLANDLMVFQHPRHVEHFFEAAERELGATVNRDDGLVDYEGRLTRVEAFPISVDFRALDGLARSAGAERWMERLRRRLKLRDGQALVVSVDRLDYTKGIPERLLALERFFQQFPRWRGRMIFAQKSSPSRTQIRAYRQLQHRVEGEIARLNTSLGTPEWTPIVHLSRPLPPQGMAALYRLADACVVSSLQDGMNLVAKEYIATQVEERGVLLLSELTGAHSELSWALPINPYDASGTAAALAEGLAMPAEERQARLRHLRTYVAEHDIYHWMEQHLRAASHVLASRSETRWLRDHLGEIADRVIPRARFALVLDFDGTLAPIVPAPEQAALPDRVRDHVEGTLQLRIPRAPLVREGGERVLDPRAGPQVDVPQDAAQPHAEGAVRVVRGERDRPFQGGAHREAHREVVHRLRCRADGGEARPLREPLRVSEDERVGEERGRDHGRHRQDGDVPQDWDEDDEHEQGDDGRDDRRQRGEGADLMGHRRQSCEVEGGPEGRALRGPPHRLGLPLEPRDRLLLAATGGPVGHPFEGRTGFLESGGGRPASILLSPGGGLRVGPHQARGGAARGDEPVTHGRPP